jgi:hypothetical protein
VVAGNEELEIDPLELVQAGNGTGDGFGLYRQLVADRKDPDGRVVSAGEEVIDEFAGALRDGLDGDVFAVGACPLRLKAASTSSTHFCFSDP